MKKWLWVLVIALPILATIEVIATIKNVDFAYRMSSPKYAEVTESELAHLDSKSLARLSLSLMGDHRRMTEWWNSTRDTYALMVYLLLGLVFLFAAILGVVLRRMPPGSTLDKDAGPAARPG